MIRANVRVPDLVMGDFHAQIAGGAVGGERLLEFMEEFGFERLEPLSDEIVVRTERAMREAIGRLAPGTLRVLPHLGRLRRAADRRVPLRGRAATACGSTSRAPRPPAVAASTW